MAQSGTSWWEPLIAGLSRKDDVPPPPRPAPPKVDERAWARNVEQARISPYLGAVHDLGLIVFGETQSYSDRPDSNEPIVVARQKLAHTILNADARWGAERRKYARTHGAVEPSPQVLRNSAVRAAYDSSMQAAREAFLRDDDPTQGAFWAIQKLTSDRSNHKFPGGRPEGVPISTQSGPYDNSYTAGEVKTGAAWLNTYWDR